MTDCELKHREKMAKQALAGPMSDPEAAQDVVAWWRRELASVQGEG